MYKLVSIIKVTDSKTVKMVLQANLESWKYESELSFSFQSYTLEATLLRASLLMLLR